jgi:hypothetical protein
VIGVFADQYLSEQVGGRNPLVDDVGRHRRLHDRLTGLAGPLAADMALYTELTRLVIQLLADVFADARQLTPTLTGRRLGIVVDLRTGQLRWQRLASRL